MSVQRLRLPPVAWPADAPARGAGDLPRWLGRGAVALAVLGSIGWFAAPFLGSADGRPDLAIYADDFFYYVEIARHVLAGQGFTFDGVTRTNGFHPLWMAVMLAFGLAAPVGSAGFFVLIQATLCAATLAAAFGCYRMLRETFFYGGVQALAGAALACVQALMLARNGMETALALPLIFLAVVALGRLLPAPSGGRALVASLLACGAILARLDAAILFAMLALVAGFAAWRCGRLASLMAPRVLAGLAVGALPLLAYLAANLMLFGALQPMSGRAKQLAEGFVFNPIGLIVLGWGLQQLAELRLAPVFVLTGLPALLAAQMLALSLMRRTIPPGAPHSLLWAIAVFPLAYYGILGLISTWDLWPWYLYPVVPTTAIAAAGVTHAAIARDAGTQPAAPGRAGWALALPIVAGVAGFAMIMHEAPRRTAQGGAMIETSRTLAAFAAGHPGRYAMGDRAGSFAFLTDQPVVQLEGLVGDAALLAAIRSRRPLFEELAARGVDYYVGTDMPREGECRRGVEPHVNQAGSRAPRMEGVICGSPVLAFVGSDLVEVLVFDLRRAHGAGRPEAAPR